MALHFAEQFFWAAEKVTPAEISDSRAYDGNGGHYVELHAQRKDAATHAVVDIVLFVRYDDSGAFVISCIAPLPAVVAPAARFHTLALSVRSKA